MIVAILEALISLLAKWLEKSKPPAPYNLEKGQADAQDIDRQTDLYRAAVTRDADSLRKQSDDVNAAIKREL